MARSIILLFFLTYVVLYNAKELYVGGISNVPPFIISRQEWGAREPKTTIDPLSENPPGYVIIHHSDTSGCKDRSSCISKVKSFQNYHMDVKNWSDIGYNFVVGGDNNIYEGRGWGKRGAHSKLYNAKSIGICLVGNFTDTIPNVNQIAVVKHLIDWAAWTNKVKSNYTLLGHRQTAQTDCPGDQLYLKMQTWPHWSANP